MSFGHFTLPTRHVQKTAGFLERTLRYTRTVIPANMPIEAAWLDNGHGQAIHVIHVAGFEASPFEGEFGRHIAILYPLREIAALKERLGAEGVATFLPERPSPFERFFFRDPINGYVFEVIDGEQGTPGQER